MTFLEKMSIGELKERGYVIFRKEDLEFLEKAKTANFCSYAFQLLDSKDEGLEATNLSSRLIELFNSKRL